MSMLPTYCPRKAELIEQVRKAISELMLIHDDEMKALQAEDFELLDQLRVKLKASREHKAGLIDLYRDHVHQHGC